jgi:hypothetical protein
MKFYHLTSTKNLQSILKLGLLPFTCYEWCGLYDGTISKDTPIIWFTDSIREKGSYLHPSKCLIQVDSAVLDNSKLNETKKKGWWIYSEPILEKDICLVPWELYRKQKPKFWDKAMGIIGGGIKHTFGESQAAINLMGNILEQPEYRKYKRVVCRKLSKQIKAMKALMIIENKVLRKDTLKMWHDKFISLTADLPEIIKTHTRCVETGIYRQLLKDSK